MDKRKSDTDIQSESETEPKKQRVEDDNSEEMCTKYQQYWDKLNSARLQTKLVDASKNSPNVCSQNSEKSNRSDEQGTR